LRRALYRHLHRRSDGPRRAVRYSLLLQMLQVEMHLLRVIELHLLLHRR
jgi:hypothetical protein